MSSTARATGSRSTSLRLWRRRRVEPVPPPPRLSDPDAFTFGVLTLDLDMELGTVGMTEAGGCHSVSMHHVSGDRIIDLHQLDLSAARVVPDRRLSDEGRQERVLRSCRGDNWFIHADRRVHAPYVVDTWWSPSGDYLMWRGFIDRVYVQAVFLGYSDREAVSMMAQLEQVG